jgi:hypothetical protein
MSAGAKRSASPAREPITFEDAIETPRPYAFSVGVRTKLGDDLEGLEAHGDGISFRSPKPIDGGQIIELVICRAILVEARIVGCALMPGESGGYWVRARFHQTSPTLSRLISEELNRLMQMES